MSSSNDGQREPLESAWKPFFFIVVPPTLVIILVKLLS